MRNRIFTSLFFILSFVSLTFAAPLSDKDASELLNLVETDQDYFDALDLISSADNFDELSANKDLQILVLKLGNDDRATPEWASEKIAEKSDDKKTRKPPKSATDGKSLWSLFVLSFLAGIAALLTPCVFPMIPMTVSFFTKQSKTKAAGIRNAMLYGVSIIVIYILLGTVVTAIFGPSVLNEMSTNPWFNIAFFVLLVVFAVSFMGAFEIRLPSKWVNSADSKADKGGVIGIFFMALVLALVSFSCTGPIVGTLIVEAASKGGIAPVVGMFGFSFALALPFTLFAIFPGWLNSMPQSGGWLNTVKVFLGFLELALAFKFLSNADLAWQSHLLERELFIAIWIAIFGVLAMYLFGKLRLPHDDVVEKVSVGRAMLGILTLTLVVYMIPGLWGAPLKLINAFPPPSHYAESPLGFGGGGSTGGAEHGPKGTHLGAQKLWLFNDFDEALAYAQKEGKPLMIDFTGWNCVNCRKMEENVWGEPGVIEHLREDIVIVSLYIDERKELPKSQQGMEKVDGRDFPIITVGDKWMYKEISDYNIASQPYYRLLGPDGEDLENGFADYMNHGNANAFGKWIREGLKLYEEAKKK